MHRAGITCPKHSANAASRHHHRTAACSPGAREITGALIDDFAPGPGPADRRRAFGDRVDCFRRIAVSQVKYRLIAGILQGRCRMAHTSPRLLPKQGSQANRSIPRSAKRRQNRNSGRQIGIEHRCALRPGCTAAGIRAD